MAGEKRRTKCDKCNRLFQYGKEDEITHRLKSTFSSSIEKRTFCSTDCLIEYAKQIKKDGKEKYG